MDYSPIGMQYEDCKLLYWINIAFIKNIFRKEHMSLEINQNTDSMVNSKPEEADFARLSV